MALCGGTQLGIAGDGWYQDLDLRPEEMVKALCSAVGRAFTADERALVPSGAPTTPPCEGTWDRTGGLHGPASARG